MGFFSHNGNQQNVETPPISQERLIEYFKSEEWNYFIDNEGDLGGTWNDNQYFFLFRGQNKELLHIQGRWHQALDIALLERVRDFIDAWHREKLWPKCYHRINDSGDIRVFSEVTIDYEHGATDEQLSLHVQCALGTSRQFYDALAEALDL